MYKYQRLIGTRVNKLLIIDTELADKKRYFICKCDCGTIKKYLRQDIYRFKVKSCGCIRKNHISITILFKKEYNTYNNMKKRCYDEKNAYYKYYGLKGIKICERWLSGFSNFLEDMGRKPTKNHSIDRIDVNGDYCPENCRWATDKEQARNKTNTAYYEYNGEKMLIVDFCKKFNVTHSQFFWHIKNGKSLQEIIDYCNDYRRKPKCHNFHTYKGIEKNQSEWASFFGVTASSMSSRIKKLKDFNKVAEYYSKKYNINI